MKIYDDASLFHLSRVKSINRIRRMVNLREICDRTYFRFGDIRLIEARAWAGIFFYHYEVRNSQN